MTTVRTRNPKDLLEIAINLTDCLLDEALEEDNIQEIFKYSEQIEVLYEQLRHYEDPQC